MAASSPSYRVYDHRLEIHDLNKLYDVIDHFASNPDQELQVTDIDIGDELETSESDEDKMSDMEGPRGFDDTSRIIASIIDGIHSTGGLESFRWVRDVDEKGATREVCFWSNLWDTARTLKYLDIRFFEHELHRFANLTGDESIPRPPKFPALKSLRIDASGGHGDNGSMVDQILRNAPGLEELTLIFPGCDLEACRIKGITWEYTFPALKRFSISTYNSDNTALSKFLASHPTITTLDWNVDADEELILPPACLPNLRVLKLDSMDVLGALDAVSTAISISPRPIIRIGVEDCSHDSLSKVAVFAKTLKSLDLNIYVNELRPDSDSDEEIENKARNEEETAGLLHNILKNLLLQLHDLQELGFDLETGNTYISSGVRGKSEHPEPIGVKDLISILNILPPSTRIHTLRMSDSRGLKLPDEILNQFPDIPKSLEYLKWDTGKRAVLYRLERGAGKVRAVPCEQQRI